MTTKQKIEDCFYNAQISELPALIDSLIAEVGVGQNWYEAH